MCLYNLLLIRRRKSQCCRWSQEWRYNNTKCPPPRRWRCARLDLSCQWRLDNPGPRRWPRQSCSWYSENGQELGWIYVSATSVANSLFSLSAHKSIWRLSSGITRGVLKKWLRNSTACWSSYLESISQKHSCLGERGRPSLESHNTTNEKATYEVLISPYWPLPRGCWQQARSRICKSVRPRSSSIPLMQQ